MARPRVEVRPSATLTNEEHQLIASLRARIDYGPPALGYKNAAKTWRTLAWSDGELASHVGILERTVEVAGHPVKVGGISGVWTVPEHRGQGLGRVAMEAAAAFIRDELRAEFAMLFCREHVRPFYERLGWRPVRGPLLFDQPTGKVTWPLLVMVLPFGSREWPEGTIDLCGLPW